MDFSNGAFGYIEVIRLAGFRFIGENLLVGILVFQEFHLALVQPGRALIFAGIVEN